METTTNTKETTNMETTPTMPRIAKQKIQTLGLIHQHGIDNPICERSDEELCKDIGLNQKQLDGYRTYVRYIDANPMFSNPSHRDLPLHLQRGATGNGGWEWSVGIFVTCDTEQDLYYSRKAATEAAAEGRTVWAGFKSRGGAGWVAPSEVA